jgi:hypothetical protein
MFALLGGNWGFGRAVLRISLKTVEVTEHVSVLMALLEASVLGIGVEGICSGASLMARLIV